MDRLKSAFANTRQSLGQKLGDVKSKFSPGSSGTPGAASTGSKFSFKPTFNRPSMPSIDPRAMLNTVLMYLVMALVTFLFMWLFWKFMISPILYPPKRKNRKSKDRKSDDRKSDDDDEEDDE